MTAIAQVFPHAQHLLCRFHALRAAFRRLRQHVSHGTVRRRWADHLTRLLRTLSKRSGRRRLEKRQAEAQASPAQAVVARLLAKVPQLLPAVGSTWRPTTSNAAARFLGAFDRFYRCKGPFQRVAAAQKHGALFMWGDVFETFPPKPQRSARADALCNWQATRAGPCRCVICAIDPMPPECATPSRRTMIPRRKPYPPPSLSSSIALVGSVLGVVSLESVPGGIMRGARAEGKFELDFWSQVPS